MWFRREVRSAALALVAAVALAACHDMSARDYYIFGQPQASRPATQAPQQLPGAAAPSAEAPAPTAPTPGAPLEPVTPEGAPPPLTQAAPAGRPVVALLLPLSGPNATLGRALLDAASLATFDIGSEGFVLLPRDTAGTPDGAAAAAQAAVGAGARLILGPLFATEVPAVAGVAGPAGINVVSLSNDRAVAGPGVFVLGLSPQGQVQRVVGFAASRGLRNFAALVPNNSFGTVVEEAFRGSVAATGGQVAMVEHYDPGADATPAVRRVAAYAARSGGASTDQPGSPAAAGAGSGALDAVLLPDFGDRLLSIAPLLPYYDVDPAQVKFLGTALWEDPRVTREPALAAGWFAAPPPAARADFVKRYTDVYGHAPPRLATLAYDATALAAVLARNTGGADFSAEAIANPNGYAGTDGIFRFRTDGTAERGLAVLEVRRDGFRILSPAPEDFREVTR